MEKTETKETCTVSEFMAKQCVGQEWTGAILLTMDKKGEAGIRMANMSPAKIAWMKFVLERYMNKDMDELEKKQPAPRSPEVN